VVKVFVFQLFYNVEKGWKMKTKAEEAKAIADSLNDLSKTYVDFIDAMKGTAKELRNTKQLWRSGNHSKLIKLGIALIVFPEPTPISEIVGSILVAAGTVQKRIRNRALYAEDIHKSFKDVLKEVNAIKENL